MTHELQRLVHGGSRIGDRELHRPHLPPRVHQQGQPLEPELLSRVMATVRFVSWGAIPIGSLTAGVLASGAGPRAALVVFCLLAALTPVVVFSSRLRTVRSLEDLDQQALAQVPQNVR